MKNALRIILVMTAAGIISAAALALVYQQVEPRVEAHQAEALRKAVLGVIPGGYEYREIREDENTAYFKIYDAEGILLGYALPGQGLGYGGVIRLMVGATVDLQATTGLVILENLETPGLGARITEASFLKQFCLLPLKPKPVLVKDAVSASHEVSSVTGATISSQAVVNIINHTISRYRPLIISGGEQNNG